MTKKYGVVFLIIVMIFSLIGCKSEDDAVKELDETLLKLMPDENFKWAYIGKDEYYHEMLLESITVSETKHIYKVTGAVQENAASGSAEDFNIEIFYEVEGNSIVQNKNAPMMLDSEYDRMTLIKAPLEIGTKWSEEVKDFNDKKHTIHAEIVNIVESDKVKTYDVVYKNSKIDYSERRQISEGFGVVTFTKVIGSGEQSAQYGYALYGRNSGYISASNTDENDDSNSDTEEGDELDSEEDLEVVDLDDESSSDAETAEPDAVVVDEAYEVEKAIIAFNNAWIKYVNDNNQDFFNYVVKNSTAYNNAKNFDKTNLKEEFLTMDISNIVVNGNVATARVYEEIRKDRSGEISISKYNWLYDLVKKDGKWLVNGYKIQ
jgi:hypothetical protein